MAMKHADHHADRLGPAGRRRRARLALALGCSSMTTGIMAREAMAAATRTAATCARVPHRRQGDQAGEQRQSSERERAEAADAAVAHDLERAARGRRRRPAPSAVSASPSSCRAPVASTIAAIASSAAGSGGSPSQRGQREGAAPPSRPDHGAHQREGVDRRRQVAHGHVAVELRPAAGSGTARRP